MRSMVSDKRQQLVLELVDLAVERPDLCDLLTRDPDPGA
jgi:hypothetical protein